MKAKQSDKKCSDKSYFDTTKSYKNHCLTQNSTGKRKESLNLSVITTQSNRKVRPSFKRKVDSKTPVAGIATLSRQSDLTVRYRGMVSTKESDAPTRELKDLDIIPHGKKHLEISENAFHLQQEIRRSDEDRISIEEMMKSKETEEDFQ